MKVSFLWKPYHIAPYPHPSPHTTHPSLLTAPPILRSTTIRTKRSSMMSLLPYMVEWSQVVWRLSPSLSTSYFCIGVTCACCWAMFTRPIPALCWWATFVLCPSASSSLSLLFRGVFHTFTCLYWLLVTGYTSFYGAYGAKFLGIVMHCITEVFLWIKFLQKQVGVSNLNVKKKLMAPIYLAVLRHTHNWSLVTAAFPRERNYFVKTYEKRCTHVRVTPFLYCCRPCGDPR